MDALYSGTFTPGDLNAQNAAGNACNTADCIFSSNLLIRDASPAEIEDYVEDCVETVTVTLGASSTPVATNPIGASISITSGTTSSSVTNTQAASTTAPPNPPVVSNYQVFTGALLGIGAPAVTGPDSNNQFAVAGDNGLFTILKQALARSCDNQKNACANAANQQHIEVTQCDNQQTQCKAETGSSDQN